MKTITINNNRRLSQSSASIGFKDENNIEKIKFVIPEEFKNYNKKVCLKVGDVVFGKLLDNDILTLTSEITQYSELDLSIEFFDNSNNIIARTSKMHLVIEDSIVCEDVSPDEPKVVILNELIEKVNKGIEQVDNLDIDIKNTTVTIVKKDGSTKSVNVKGDKGEKGDTGNSGVHLGTEEPTDPLINVWVDSDGEPDPIDYESAENKPKINGVPLVGNKTNADLGIPTKTSDLFNNSGYVSSDTIVSIKVVDELPENEEEGVLYLVKEHSVPTNLLTNATIMDAYISSSENKILTASGNSDKIAYIECEPNTTYLISKETSTKRFRVAYTTVVPADNILVSGLVKDDSATSIQITTGYDAQYLAIYFWMSGDTLTSTQIFDGMTLIKV